MLSTNENFGTLAKHIALFVPVGTALGITAGIIGFLLVPAVELFWLMLTMTEFGVLLFVGSWIMTSVNDSRYFQFVLLEQGNISNQGQIGQLNQNVGSGNMLNETKK